MRSLDAKPISRRRVRVVAVPDEHPQRIPRPVPLRPLRGDGLWTGASTLLLAAALGYGLWSGGYVEKTYADLSARGAQLAVEAGFGVQRLTVEGQRRTSDAEIVKALQMDNEESLFGYDTKAARRRLEELPWVQHAQVMRLLPSTLHVSLKEREPYAVWQIKGVTHLIDDTGAVLARAARREHMNLPFVVGVGAAGNARPFMTMLADYPAISKHSLAAIRVADRRWTLKLASGAEVLLPEINPVAALQQLDELHSEHAVLTKPFARIDLRLADRVTFRPAVKPEGQAATAAAREKPIQRTGSRDT